MNGYVKLCKRKCILLFETVWPVSFSLLRLSNRLFSRKVVQKGALPRDKRLNWEIPCESDLYRGDMKDLWWQGIWETRITGNKNKSDHQIGLHPHELFHFIGVTSDNNWDAINEETARGFFIPETIQSPIFVIDGSSFDTGHWHSFFLLFVIVTGK